MGLEESEHLRIVLTSYLVCYIRSKQLKLPINLQIPPKLEQHTMFSRRQSRLHKLDHYELFLKGQLIDSVRILARSVEVSYDLLIDL
jgi:hypothetical protein